MYFAAIDIGTNSARLLIARECDGRLVPVCRELATTRLGADLIRTGYLSPAGRAATVAAITTFVAQACSYRPERIEIIATSAMRKAHDGHEFAGQLAHRVNFPVQIISAEKEALYSYTGVTKSLSTEESTVVFDLGGGSCELIWQKQCSLQSQSYPIGALYMTDTFFQHNPPLAEEVEAARHRIIQYLTALAFRGRPLVGVGGTVTTLAAMSQKLPAYNPDKIHAYILRQNVLQELLSVMLALSAEKRAGLPGIHQERAGILPAGTLVVLELLAACGADSLVVSEGDLLFGCLYAAIS